VASADETKLEVHPQGPDGVFQASTACEAPADPGVIFAKTDQGVREVDPARDDRGGGPCEVAPFEPQLAASPGDDDSPALAAADPLPDPVEFARFDAEVTTWLEAADQQMQQELVSEPPPDAPLAESDSPAPTLAPSDPLPNPAEFARFDAEVTTWLEAADQQMQQEIERETQRLIQQQQQPRAR
jgi:hypothetical protein